MSADRVFEGYECDHMRPLVRVDGVWHHIGSEGRVAGPCGATSAYRVTATYSGVHTLEKYVRDARSDR